ncbi:MAG: transcription elongation factor Spt5 [Candidatus Aenigmarchaeota archaeon]|nr:transcription elongation factor Spt5 [Candidatus Aenigmarchaeota archaeon]
MIFILRTTVGRENIVINNLENKIKNTSVDIKTVFHPAELKGYLFIEGEADNVEEAIRGVPHIRGLIKKQVPISEIKKFLDIKRVEIKINRGDIVEITGGPFKGEKGKVVRVDEAKEEVTIELLEAAIPIPITVSNDSVRVTET